MHFWIPFLTIPSAPMTSGIAFVLSCHICVTSVSRSLYLESLWYFYNKIFSLAGTVTSNTLIPWSLSLLCLVDLHLFFYLCIKQSFIVPLHFLFVLLVLLCICTIFRTVVSRNPCIVSNVITSVLFHVSSISSIHILCGLQSLRCLYTTYIRGHPTF